MEIRHMVGTQGLAPGIGVEEPYQCHRVRVVHGHDHVGIANIVNPGYVLVPDALDPMRPKPIAQEGRALERL